MTRSFHWLKGRLARAGAACVVLSAAVGCTQTGSNLKNGRGSLTPPPAMNGAGNAPKTPMSPAFNNLQSANTVPGAGTNPVQPGGAPLSGSSLPPTRIGTDSRVGPATTVGNQMQPAGFNSGGSSFNSSGVPGTMPGGPGAIMPPASQANYQPQALPQGATLPQTSPGLLQSSLVLPNQQQPMPMPVNNGPAIQPTGATLPMPSAPPAGAGLPPAGMSTNQYSVPLTPSGSGGQPGAMAPMAGEVAHRGMPAGAQPVAMPQPAPAPASNDQFVLPPLDPAPARAMPMQPAAPNATAAAPAAAPAPSGLREFSIPRRAAPPPLMPSTASDPAVIPPAPTLIPSVDASPALPPLQGR